METFETIDYEKGNGTATITLNRPDHFNAITHTMLSELVQALKNAERDKAIRCIVLTGAGRAFCAGQDIHGIDETVDYGEMLAENYHPVLQTLQATTKPVIAAVNGVAAGAGMSLALAADFRIVRPDTKFVSAFMGIGLIPDCGFIYILPRLVGYAKALEIATIGKPIAGAEIIELGLASGLVDAEEWETGVSNFASQFKEVPTKAFALVKRYMMAGMHSSFEDVLVQEAKAQRIAGKTKDHMEGMQAFKEKRQPTFVGE